MAKSGQKPRKLSVLGTFEPKQLLNHFAVGTLRSGRTITRADRAGQIKLFMRNPLENVRGRTVNAGLPDAFWLIFRVFLCAFAELVLH